MRKVILSCAAITVAMIAAPAAAQYNPAPNHGYGSAHAGPAQAYGNDMAGRIGQLQIRLDEGVRVGSITRREARPIRQQIREVSALERQYSVNGLTGQERAALQQRIRIVRQQLRQADDRAQGQYDQWDREDSYAWGPPQSGRIDANRDGWDDRDYNRNGRWDDDVNYGYQQQPPQPTGLGGLINSVLGGRGLQVGQRVPANLYTVPYQHQAHFRDGNGVYYRSDGRQIYQVDVRSHTVTRVFPI